MSPAAPPPGNKGPQKPAPPRSGAVPASRPPAPRPGAPPPTGVRPAATPPSGMRNAGPPRSGATPAAKGPPPPAAKGPPPKKAPPAAAAGPPLPAIEDPNVERAGRYFEVRKGRAKGDGEESEEDDRFEVALPRSIIQEQEEADLKRRFGTEQLPDIAERHSSLTVTEAAPATMARKAGGKWFLILIVLLLLAGVGTTFKAHILEALKKAGILAK